MKKTLVALSLAAMTLPALAQDKKAPEPDYTITGNFGLFSDYRFRGISQTDKKMAAQGGFDFAHKSGVYLGTWTSNVADWANTNGNGQEIDVYGGVKYSVGPIGLDLGYLAYIYPGNDINPKQGTREWYLGAAYGPVSYKFSRTTGNWFGIANSSGSIYHDLSATFPINEDLSVLLHVGKQDVKASGNDDRDFTDSKLQINYSLKDGFVLGLAYINVSSLSTAAKTNGFTTTAGVKLYESGAVISLTKTL
jgi:uncharacterized protein (TIGR02001 family)